MKYAWIKQYRHLYPLHKICVVLRVSRSGYYDWCRRSDSTRQRANELLLTHIRRVHQQSREHYGAIKCWKQLNREGIECGRDRVVRLRRRHGIYAKRRRRFVVTTRSKHSHWIADNHVQRRFNTRAPNQTWVGDVTFIATGCGWLYLCVLLDLYSRKVVGWSMSGSNNGELAKSALNMALQHRQPDSGLIHHTDRGSTYAMGSYQAMLKEHGILASMSRKGDCWDNAVAESFFGSLKNELTYWCRFDNHEQAKSAIFDYIEIFYNRQRLHQTLNYQTPEQFEQQYNVA